MKILKEGNLNYSLKVKTFQCDSCGCQFEANSKEYDNASQMAYFHDGITAECKCPCCGNVVYSHD